MTKPGEHLRRMAPSLEMLGTLRGERLLRAWMIRSGGRCEHCGGYIESCTEGAPSVYTVDKIGFLDDGA